MDVRVDETGQDRRAVEIDDARARPVMTLGIDAATDEDDAIAADRDRLRVGSPACESCGAPLAGRPSPSGSGQASV